MDLFFRRRVVNIEMSPKDFQLIIRDACACPLLLRCASLKQMKKHIKIWNASPEGYSRQRSLGVRYDTPTKQRLAALAKNYQRHIGVTV